MGPAAAAGGPGGRVCDRLLPLTQFLLLLFPLPRPNTPDRKDDAMGPDPLTSVLAVADAAPVPPGRPGTWCGFRVTPHQVQAQTVASQQPSWPRPHAGPTRVLSVSGECSPAGSNHKRVQRRPARNTHAPETGFLRSGEADSHSWSEGAGSTASTETTPVLKT